MPGLEMPRLVSLVGAANALATEPSFAAVLLKVGVLPAQNVHSQASSPLGQALHRTNGTLLPNRPCNLNDPAAHAELTFILLGAVMTSSEPRTTELRSSPWRGCCGFLSRFQPLVFPARSGPHVLPKIKNPHPGLHPRPNFPMLPEAQSPLRACR